MVLIALCLLVAEGGLINCHKYGHRAAVNYAAQKS